MESALLTRQVQGTECNELAVNHPIYAGMVILLLCFSLILVALFFARQTPRVLLFTSLLVRVYTFLMI